MRTRYFRDEKGRPAIKAVVYDKPEHNVSRSSIDIDARKICTRLRQQGHEAYIVGGAVRDLLIGRTPKDFDIATDASPNRVKRLFRNSRIIGKRFRLVHVYFQGGKIHEVATFRAPDSGDRNHVFGTLNEDVLRRDFSLNALYFDPEEETIIDFVHGVRDIRKGVVKSVLPLASSFTEDPVRMLRAIKYSAITGMRIASDVGRKIRKQAELLSTASVSRLSEELFKILNSGNAESIFRMMDNFGLLKSMLPNFENAFNDGSDDSLQKEDFFKKLAELDQQLIHGKVGRAVMVRYLTENALETQGILSREGNKVPVFIDTVRALKDLLRPMVQPNRDVEEAVRLMFAERGYKIPKKRPRHPETRAGEQERDRVGTELNDKVKRRHRRRRKKNAAVQTGKETA